MVLQKANTEIDEAEALLLARDLDRWAEIKEIASEFNSLSARLKKCFLGISYVRLGDWTVVGRNVPYAANPGFMAGQSWRWEAVKAVKPIGKRRGGA